MRYDKPCDGPLPFELDTEGVIALFEALNNPCCCESEIEALGPSHSAPCECVVINRRFGERLNGHDCRFAPLYRWWFDWARDNWCRDKRRVRLVS